MINIKYYIADHTPLFAWRRQENTYLDNPPPPKKKSTVVNPG